MAVAPLVKADGTPWKRVLETEIAAASMMTARSVLTGHPADGLDPGSLVAILRNAEDGDAVEYLELAEAMEEKDAHYASVLGTRKRQVSQLPITVEAASDGEIDLAKAQLVRDWVKRDTLQAEIFDILDAIGKGFSVTEIVWDTKGPWLPAKLIWRDPRWFQFDRIDGTTPLLRGNGPPTRLPVRKFITHVHSAKSGLPIRGGIARIAAWVFLFKSLGLKDWVTYAEVFGFPVRVGKYGAGASEDQIRTLMRAVASVSTDMAAVFPDSMSMEFVKAEGNGSADLYERLCGYLDRQLSKLVLGQTATTDSEGGGLGGSGKEHNDVRGDIERSDAKQLAATINRDLVKPLIDLNFGAGPYPQIVIGREDPVDTKALMEGVKSFVEMGGRVGATVIADRLGIPDPADGEQLLTAPKSAAPTNPVSGAPAQPAGPFPPELAATALLGPLKASYEALSTGASGADGGGGAKDDIDALVAMMTDEGWQAVLGPMLDPAIAALAAAGNYDAALAALPATLAAMDADTLATRLERAAFAVRAVTRAGADATSAAGADGAGSDA
jgi:phage gp29-like protein